MLLGNRAASERTGFIPNHLKLTGYREDEEIELWWCSSGKVREVLTDLAAADL